jgi:hypothetical protein
MARPQITQMKSPQITQIKWPQIAQMKWPQIAQMTQMTTWIVTGSSPQMFVGA